MEEDKQDQKPAAEFLEVKRSAEQEKKAAVFSLLNSNERAKGTFKVEASGILDRVRQFLPQIQAANSQIQSVISTKPEVQKDLDIETVPEGKPFIEMNLAMYEEDSDSEESIEPSDSISEDQLNIGPVTEENFRLPGQSRAKQLVKEMSSDESSDEEK